MPKEDIKKKDTKKKRTKNKKDTKKKRTRKKTFRKKQRRGGNNLPKYEIKLDLSNYVINLPARNNGMSDAEYKEQIVKPYLLTFKKTFPTFDPCSLNNIYRELRYVVKNIYNEEIFKSLQMSPDITFENFHKKAIDLYNTFLEEYEPYDHTTSEFCSSHD
jgi:hypothetical protein